MNAKVTSIKSKDRSAITTGVLKWILVNLAFLLALGFSLFLAAGRLDWGPGWLYLGVIVASQTATTLILLVANPTLLGERAWMQKGSKTWDKVIVSLCDAGWIVMAIVAGLDARFGWTPRLAMAFPVAGWVLLVLGFLLFLWAMASNRFFSSFMRIQTDRGHTVETGGPYRYVRHPSYMGAMFTYIASPLALSSLWTFLPAALLVALFVYRAALEDRTLQVELKGYADYARRVRYRLLPGFLITTGAYRAFVEANHLQSQILALATDPALPGEAASLAIRRLFELGRLPAEIATAIHDAYTKLKQLPGNSSTVAVRSSATAEDLPGASFAGQQDSYLNVRGEHALLDAMKRCWASLWTARALEYRARKNNDQSSVSVAPLMAVVVQKMVPAEAARSRPTWHASVTLSRAPIQSIEPCVSLPISLPSTWQWPFKANQVPMSA